MITVIIPAYKAANTIQRSVLSALTQGSLVEELIVVVDGADKQICNAIAAIDDARVKIVVFKENQGSQRARNAGLEKATSKYVIFLDADDYFEPLHIASLFEAIASCSADMALGPNSIEHSACKDKLFYFPKTKSNFNRLVGLLLSTDGIGCQCILWRRWFLHQIGGWNEAITRVQDGELFMRALVNGARIAVSSDGGGCSVQHDGYRISKNRTIDTFSSQVEIYNLIAHHIAEGQLAKKERQRLGSALAYFCLRTYTEMTYHGFKGAETDSWKKRINWRLYYFIQLPKRRSAQALLFLVFGSRAFSLQRIVKDIYDKRCNSNI